MQRGMLTSLIILGLALGSAAAQGIPSTPGGVVDTISARPADVESVDGIIAAFYQVISGPAGEPRDWARDRTLYVPGVRFVALGVQNGRPVAHIMTHDEYIARTSPGLVANGFYEIEVARRTERFGNMLHAWSTYEFRRSPDGAVLGRGINSIQLYHDGKRWWITAVMWDNERTDNPLPEA